MLPPRSATLCFFFSSTARCWCSSVCALGCSLAAARARVKPLLVLDCRPAALLVARACLSDRCSCSHERLPLLAQHLPVVQRIGILLVLAFTCGRGCIILRMILLYMTWSTEPVHIAHLTRLPKYWKKMWGCSISKKLKNAAVSTTDRWLKLNFTSCVIRQTRSLSVLVLCPNCSIVFVN